MNIKIITFSFYIYPLAMIAPSNTICYTILKAVLKSEVEQEIIKTLQKEVGLHRAKNWPFYFKVDFRLTRFLAAIKRKFFQRAHRRGG